MSAMYEVVITLAALAVTVTSVSHNDAVHVGCFKTNLVDTQRSYYMVNEPLSWENGISACINRYTTHAAVQAVNRTSSMIYFFCGNDLLEHSVQLKESGCALCLDPAHVRCGGPETLSIYKIRDSTPLVLMLATSHGIRSLVVAGSSSNFSSPLQVLTNSLRLDLLYSKDEFVFRTYPDDVIYKSLFIYQSKHYGTPLKLKGNPKSWSLAVDWLHENIYFCAKPHIMEYSMSTQISRKLYTANDQCVDLAIDPFTRTLFVVLWNGTLSSFSLYTNFSHTYNGGEDKLQGVWRVALDYEKQLIYVSVRQVGPNNKRQDILMSLDYADTGRTVEYQGSLFHRPHGLDVFNGSIVWTDNSNKIYICNLTPDCKEEDIQLLHLASDVSTENSVKG